MFLGVARFKNCSLQFCKRTLTIPSGTSVDIDISFDYLYGGIRNEKQQIHTLILKDSSTGILVYCQKGHQPCYMYNDIINSIHRPINDPWNITVSINDTSLRNTSIFTIEASLMDVSSTQRIASTITLAVTVSLTSQTLSEFLFSVVIN